MYHVEHAIYQYSEKRGALAVDGQTERDYTTETSRTPIPKIFWPKKNYGKERLS
jgi:hypothetical protein